MTPMTIIPLAMMNGKPHSKWIGVSAAMNLLQVGILLSFHAEAIYVRQVESLSVAKDKSVAVNPKQPPKRGAPNLASDNAQSNLIANQQDGRVTFSKNSFFGHATAPKFGVEIPFALGVSLQLSDQERHACEGIIKNTLEVCITYEREYLQSNVTNIIPPQPNLYQQASETIRMGLERIVDSERAGIIAEFYLASPLFAPLLLEREMGRKEMFHSPTNTHEVVGAVQVRLDHSQEKPGWAKTVNAQDNPDLFRIRYMPLIDWNAFLER